MFTAAKVVFFRALSGLHAGSGTDLGIVDSPIQRERFTGFPKLESSGIKGCIREAFTQIELPTNDFIDVAFGPADNGDKHAGSVTFTDGRILLFPVRSARGVFAYATCPLVLNRLSEDFKIAKIAKITENDDVEISVGEKALASSSALFIDSDNVILEEYTYPAEQNKKVTALAKSIAEWLDLSGYAKTLLENNLIVLDDENFSDITQNATEIITRIRIDNKTGTVVDGALFTEELLPAETVLYSLVMSSSLFLPEDVKSETKEAAGSEQGKFMVDTLAKHIPNYLQIGGNATIGKGLVAVSVKGDS
ncbi:MAG: type III-B CRISPR module RAMP protein Cmr4 [Oscillospiraceae bacterium]|nr:type III-B CRISPR module RAMP protein Cmr4 [Oscillospiraceae bacterium]